MAAVTQTIPNFLGGVSNQPDDKKKVGQVSEAINAYPDPTFGLTKRPGFKFISELADGITTGGSDYDATDLDNGKWFYYNRDSDEKYIGCIVGKKTSSYGEIHMWNTVLDDDVVTTVDSDTIVPGTGYSETASTAYLNTTSDGSGTGLTLRITSVGGSGDITGVAVVDGGKGYAENETITIPGGNGAGRVDVATISNGVFKKCHMTYGTDARNYLGKEETADAVASVNAEDYDFLTIRDTTIITNKNRVVTEQALSPAFVSKKVATIRIHLVEYSSKYEVSVTHSGSGSSAVYTCRVSTRAGDTATNDADTTYFLSANDILNDLKDGTESGDNTYSHFKDGSGGTSDTEAGVHGIPSITAEIIGQSLELTGTVPFTVTVTGGRTGSALTSYQDTVDLITELPAESKHDRTVTINNTASPYDTYYAKFVATNGTTGAGVWEETKSPAVTPGLKDESLPHKLYNDVRNHFTFSQISYNDRIVGDDTTNEHPSFNGKTIQQAFYYNNRLGFLTEDNVSMSKSDDFYNFYMTTAQTSTDADPVDLSCSSIKPAVLHGIVPSASGLLLFSQNQQFVMFSADGNLTPNTALIRSLSNYKMETDIDPVDVGNYICFVSKTHATAGYTRVFGFQPQGIGQLPRVVDIARVVSEYIPAKIDRLIASPQNSFIAIYGKDADLEGNIYFYRTYSDGEKDLMQTWFNWKCPGDVHYVTVDSDTMYSIIKTGSGSDARYNLVSATMTQTPEEEIIVTAEGIQVNPHMDFYKAATAVTAYPVDSITVTAAGTGFGGSVAVTIAAPSDGVQATADAVKDGGAIASITITNPGSGYDPANLPAVTIAGIGGSGATATASVFDGSFCEIPFSNITTLDPVVVISGNASSDWTGTTESGLTITPGRITIDNKNYYTVPRKDLSAFASNVFLGYKYNYDVTLPKLYFRKPTEGASADYTANLTIARMKFSIGQSSVVGFKMKREAVQVETESFTADGTTTAFHPNFKVIDKSDVIVKRNKAKQTLVTAFSGSSDDQKSQYILTDHSTLEDHVTVTFGTAPAKTTFPVESGLTLGTGYSNGNNVATTGGSGTGLTVDITTSTGKITTCTVNKSGTGYKINDIITVTTGDANAQLRIATLPDEVEIYVDNWFTLLPTQEANYYLADDVPLDTQSIFTVPIHQRTDNYTLRVFSNSPFPLALTSCTWEGNYSPRYYRRT